MYDKCSDCEYKDVENLRLENQELKKQLEIKHNGFMASVEEACELAEENQKQKEVIDKLNKYLHNNYLISTKYIKDILSEVD